MRLLLFSFFAILANGVAVPNHPSPSWPNKPFVTEGRLIKDASNSTITYGGVNWPGAADVMIPEGLQYQSVASIVSKIKSLGMNVIRLTYAIEMIDDIYNGADSSLKNALKTALGPTNGTKVLNQILARNPAFTAKTTRLQVFDAVAAECYKQHIYVHLDNHVSKAIWCCSNTDGNAWFGDTYFNVSNWRRGLAYMAAHGKGWPALTSMSLRNELREPKDNATVDATYNWPTWYSNIVPAANAIHAANTDPLIFLSGLNFDTTLAPVTAGTDLGNGTRFRLSDFSYSDKLVFELHNYQNSAGSCQDITPGLYSGGYNAMDTGSNTTAENIAPVVLTEFGFAQDNSTYLTPYPQCIKSYLTQFPGGPGGWMQWVIAGSYYIREGVQDFEETWGLLSHDWSSWRSPAAVSNYTKPFVEETVR